MVVRLPAPEEEIAAQGRAAGSTGLWDIHLSRWPPTTKAHADLEPGGKRSLGATMSSRGSLGGQRKLHPGGFHLTGTGRVSVRNGPPLWQSLGMTQGEPACAGRSAVLLTALCSAAGQAITASHGSRSISDQLRVPGLDVQSYSWSCQLPKLAKA